MVRAGALVKWLWETTRVQEVVGLNLSTGRTILSLICGKIVIFVCLKRPKINEKEVGDGPFLRKNSRAPNCSNPINGSICLGAKCWPIKKYTELHTPPLDKTLVMPSLWISICFCKRFWLWDKGSFIGQYFTEWLQLGFLFLREILPLWQHFKGLGLNCI